MKLKTQKSSALSQDRQVPTYNKCSETYMQNEEGGRFQKISADRTVALHNPGVIFQT